MRIYLLICGLLLSVAFDSAFAQSTWENTQNTGKGKVIVHFLNYPPFFYEENGTLKGVEYELFEAFIDFAKRKYNVEIEVEYRKIATFTKLYNDVKTGMPGNFGLASTSYTEERAKEIGFSQPYMSDVDILISSQNLPIVADSMEFVRAFKDAKGLAARNTTYEQEMQSLIKKFPSLKVVYVEHTGEVKNRISKENNLYGFYPLASYLLDRKNGLRLKRQNLFKIEHPGGLCMIFPINSDWRKPVEEFFGSKGFDEVMRSILKKNFGDDIFDMVFTRGGDMSLIVAKEREIQEKEIAEKEERIGQTQALLSAQTVYTYILIGGAGLLVLVAIGIFSRYREKQRTNNILEQQNNLIETQKKQLGKTNSQLTQLNQEIAAQRDEISQTKDVLEVQNKKMSDSIRAAKSIQTALLPFESRMNGAFQDYFIIWLPKDVVSGDFYWLAEVEKYTFIAAIDCTGHGVPGAFMSMLGYALLNEIVNLEETLEPAEILQKLHHGINTALKQDQVQEQHGMDVCLCRIEKTSDEERHVVFAGAKRPLYFIQGGKLAKMAGDRLSCGGKALSEDISFSNYSIHLHKDDILYLTTDGYADTPNAERKRIGTAQFEGYLKEYAPFPLKWQKNKLIQNIQDFQQQEEQRDDVTIIGVKL